MANYTMELRTIEKNEKVFDFDYTFYSNNITEKYEFEKLFLEHFYYREIGFETPERFKHKLKAKLDLIMPYYAQLYKTEWNRLDKDMMNSKDLTETTTHELKSSGTSSASSDGKMSNLTDGVSQADLSTNFLTGVNQGESNGTTSTTLTETTTFNSKGDIGIQTPAYAITEWRKIIINLNETIINDCNDLFMKIY